MNFPFSVYQFHAERTEDFLRGKDITDGVVKGKFARQICVIKGEIQLYGYGYKESRNNIRV